MKLQLIVTASLAALALAACAKPATAGDFDGTYVQVQGGGTVSPVHDSGLTLEAGKNLSNTLAVEVEYDHLFAGRGVDLANINLVLSPVTFHKITPFGEVGIGYDFHSNSVFNAGAGLRYPLSTHFSAVVAYRYYNDRGNVSAVTGGIRYAF